MTASLHRAGKSEDLPKSSIFGLLAAVEFGLLVVFVMSDPQDRSSERNLVMSSETEKEPCP